MIKYVVGFAFSRYGNNVALIEKRKPEWQKGKLNGIGGKIEDGEMHIDAMVREFKEETGVVTYPDVWTYLSQMRGKDYTLDVFKAFLHPVEFRAIRSMEEEEVRVYDVRKLFDRMIEGTTDTIHNIPMLIAMCLSDDQPPRIIDYR